MSKQIMGHLCWKLCRWQNEPSKRSCVLGLFFFSFSPFLLFYRNSKCKGSWTPDAGLLSNVWVRKLSLVILILYADIQICISSPGTSLKCHTCTSNCLLDSFTLMFNRSIKPKKTTGNSTLTHSSSPFQ